ncbi:MAG: cytochrome c1 [Proteobacteria bacterium]|nr:cytochrome c1 [Pseudomonadota bacterium]
MLKASIVITAIICGSISAYAATGDAPHPEKHDWKSAGIFGKWDQPSLQRGLQVYQQVCAACHSLDLVAFRTLDQLGYNEDEIKAIAAEYEYDVINSDGDIDARPGIPSDYFPSPFANEQAARASNGGALPPDFSVLIKSREHMSFLPSMTTYGEDYIVALMTGYEEEAPEGFDLGEGLYYNHYFPDYQIAMAPPLFDDIVEYADGTPATLEQTAYDVANFMYWASDPTMQDRKEMGLKVMIFLIIFTIMLYFTNKRIWAKVKKGEDIDPTKL